MVSKTFCLLFLQNPIKFELIETLSHGLATKYILSHLKKTFTVRYKLSH